MRFLEVIPGVCISTRRIQSVELKESDVGWAVLVFTDMEDDKGGPIVYVYNEQFFDSRDAAREAMIGMIERIGYLTPIGEVDGEWTTSE